MKILNFLSDIGATYLNKVEADVSNTVFSYNMNSFSLLWDVTIKLENYVFLPEESNNFEQQNLIEIVKLFITAIEQVSVRRLDAKLSYHVNLGKLVYYVNLDTNALFIGYVHVKDTEQIFINSFADFACTFITEETPYKIKNVLHSRLSIPAPKKVLYNTEIGEFRTAFSLLTDPFNLKYLLISQTQHCEYKSRVKINPDEVSYENF